MTNWLTVGHCKNMSQLLSVMSHIEPKINGEFFYKNDSYSHNALIRQANQLSFSPLEIKRFKQDLQRLKHKRNLLTKILCLIKDIFRYLTLLKPSEELKKNGYVNLKNLDVLNPITDHHSPKTLNERLKNCPNLTSFTLDSITNEKLAIVLRSLPCLTFLEIVGEVTEANIELIAEWLPDLKTLKIKESKELVNCNSLVNLANLTALIIEDCDNLEDLSSLGEVKQLSSLSIIKCPKVTDFSNLKKINSLTSLVISKCEQIIDIKFIEDLHCLVCLSFSYCHNIKHSESISKIKSLQHLDLSYCNQIDDIDLVELINLIYLDLSYCNQLQNVNFLEKLKLLKDLKLKGCNKILNLHSLHYLENLKSLDISFCPQLSDFRFTEHLEQLLILDISFCKIEETKFFGNLPNLTSLDVSYCLNIKELKFTEELPELKFLNIKGCDHLQESNFINKLKKLNSCTVRI